MEKGKTVYERRRKKKQKVNYKKKIPRDQGQGGHSITLDRSNGQREVENNPVKDNAAYFLVLLLEISRIGISIQIKTLKTRI